MGDFLYKCIIFAPKNFFSYGNDIGSVRFVKCKNEGLGQIIYIILALWIGEKFGIDSIAIGFEHEFYLCRIHYTAIEFLACIETTFGIVHLLHFPIIAHYTSVFISFQNSTAILCSLCFNTINTAAYIDTVFNRLFEGVINHYILIKEGQCLGNRSSC